MGHYLSLTAAIAEHGGAAVCMDYQSASVVFACLDLYSVQHVAVLNDRCAFEADGNGCCVGALDAAAAQDDVTDGSSVSHVTKQGDTVLVIGIDVQTADECILGGHTAYITDAGMTGPEDSVLGVKSELIIQKLKYLAPVKFEESECPAFLNGVVVTFDEKSGKATNIQRIISRK